MNERPAFLDLKTIAECVNSDITFIKSDFGFCKPNPMNQMIVIVYSKCLSPYFRKELLMLFIRKIGAQ